jgi:outer membrane protein TolC
MVADRGILFICFWISTFNLNAQDQVERFTLDKVLSIAKEQSPDAILAQHRFRISFWQYRSFQSMYMPSLRFYGIIPAIDRSLHKNSLPVVLPDNSTVFVDQYSENKSNFYSGTLSVSQNVGLTGGTISLNSSMERTDQIGPDSRQFAANPAVNITINQPLFGFNNMKWERKIQPLIYEVARKNYLNAVEVVYMRAVGRFFDLANAQLNLKIAQMNFCNSDTLYEIAQMRYRLGNIPENELLQMQLSNLNAKTDLMKAEIELEMQRSILRTFLGYNERMNFTLILPDCIPELKIEYQKVLELAITNNPDVIDRQRQLLEARKEIAQARGQRQNINLMASFGLSKSTYGDVLSAYDKPGENEQLKIGIAVPIIDWGQQRGRIKIAQSNEELVSIQVQQAQADFEQNIFVQVMQFNRQNDQVTISAKADTIGQKRYDVSKQRFLLGKIDALNLNDAIREKDLAKHQYLESLRDYWILFYSLRMMTLYDFKNNQTLHVDYEKLIQ